MDEPRELSWRTLPTLLYPDSTTWRIRLEPEGSSTRVVQSFQITKPPPAPVERMYARMIPSHRDRTPDDTADLRRLGEVAAAWGARGGAVDGR